MKAIILAAGSGRRIDFEHDKPKGFIELDDDQPIIHRSVTQLLAVGIEEVILVTGYQAQYYDDFYADNEQVRTIYNPRYAECDTLCSMLCARDEVTQSCIFLESDLIYDIAGVISLMLSPEENALLLSETCDSGDNVFVTVDHNHVLQKITKIMPTAEEPYGDYVGIAKVSPQLMQDLVKYAAAGDELKLTYDMDGFQHFAQKHNIKAHRLYDYVWAEIDNHSQFERAQRLKHRLRVLAADTQAEQAALHYIENTNNELPNYIKEQGIDALIISNSMLKREVIYQEPLRVIDALDLPVISFDANTKTICAEQLQQITRYQHILVVAGGGLTDTIKLALKESNCQLTICPLQLSNDGFAAGCMTVQDELGHCRTIKIKSPTQVVLLADLLQASSPAFIASGWCEVLAKLNVIEDYLLDDGASLYHYHSYLKDLIAYLNNQAGFNLIQQQQALAILLNTCSQMMVEDSAYCSRSEHEFEKLLIEHGCKLTHGQGVILGALLAMKLRAEQTRLFDYTTLVALVQRFNLQAQVIHALDTVILCLENNPLLQSALTKINTLRPERNSVWQNLELTDINWLQVLQSIQEDF